MTNKYFLCSIKLAFDPGFFYSPPVRDVHTIDGFTFLFIYLVKQKYFKKVLLRVFNSFDINLWDPSIHPTRRYTMIKFSVAVTEVPKTMRHHDKLLWLK